jgi:hypothetical protein
MPEANRSSLHVKLEESRSDLSQQLSVKGDWMSAKSHDDQMKNISSNPHPDDVDALMASELHGMTLQEREIVYEEVHGVDKEMVETPLLLAESLERMKVALEQQVPKLRLFYEHARQINPDYVDSPSFWLQFLRAEYFDAPNAALRLCRFLAGKVEFFGLDALARPIALDEDFDVDDIAWLKTGIIQILPSRDRSGRAVLADFNMQSDFPQPKKIESLVRPRMRRIQFSFVCLYDYFSDHINPTTCGE